jgi:hypothetical protein
MRNVQEPYTYNGVLSRYSAITLTVKEAEISGWSATVAGNSPVVFMDSTEIERGSTTALEARA